MMTRREFLRRSVPLVAVGAVAPEFVAGVLAERFPPKKYWDMGAIRRPVFDLECPNEGAWTSAPDVKLLALEDMARIARELHIRNMRGGDMEDWSMESDGHGGYIVYVKVRKPVDFIKLTIKRTARIDLASAEMFLPTAQARENVKRLALQSGFEDSDV